MQTKISFSGEKNNKFEIFIDLLTQKKKKTLAILNSLFSIPALISLSLN